MTNLPEPEFTADEVFNLMPPNGYPMPVPAATDELGVAMHVVVERYENRPGRSLPAMVGPVEEWSADHLRLARQSGFVMALPVFVPPGLGEEAYLVRAMDDEVPGVGFAEVVGLFVSRRNAESWIARNAAGADALVVVVRRDVQALERSQPS